MHRRHYFCSMLQLGIRVNLTHIKLITMIRTITFSQSVKSKNFYIEDKLYEVQPSYIKLTIAIIHSYRTERDYAPSYLHINLLFVPKSITFKSLMYFHSKMIKIKEAESLSATTEIINLSSARLLFPR